MSPYTATKKALREAALKLDIKLDMNRTVYHGGQDPGGWSSQGSLICVYHENNGLPNEYNHRNYSQWWFDLSERVSELCGMRVFFEPYNNCVSSLYDT